jgi:hypothetical protein
VAKADATGVIHIVCDSPDGPQYVRSADNGRTFSPPLAVVDRQSQMPGLEFSVWDMAVGQSGRVHVALGTNAWKLKLPQEEWALFHARLDPGAAAFDKVQNVNHQPSEGFSLAADERGTVTACWLSGKLYANISRDGGRTFDTAMEIDPSFDPCDCCTTSVACAADGSLALFYREETNNERDMFLVLWDPHGGPASRHRVSTTLWKIDACPMTYYKITPLPDGFLVAWPTDGQIYFARLDRQGRLLPPGEVKTRGTSGMRTGILALADPAGNVLIAWKKAGRLDWQLYNKDCQPLGPPSSVNSAGNGAAGVVTKDGRFVLCP